MRQYEHRSGLPPDPYRSKSTSGAPGRDARPHLYHLRYGVRLLCGKRRPDQLPEHGTDVSEGGIQTAGSGVLERSQPPSAAAGEEKPAGRGPGQRVHAASLRDAGLWQPVAIHLHDGDSEQGPLQIYSGVKACGRPDLMKFRFVASFCIVKKDGKNTFN